MTILGHDNWPALVAEDASGLFAKNLFNFLSPHIDKESGELKLDFGDETVSGTLVCRDGKVVNDRVADGLKKKPAAKAAPKKRTAASTSKKTKSAEE